MDEKKEIYILDSPARTKKAGALLAKEILIAGPGKSARVLAMSGELGAGKTNFAQGFAKGLGVKETINSPTFGIMKKYALPATAGFNYFYHIDCYRLDSAKDLAALGAKEIFADPKNIAAVEWPDIARPFFRAEVVAITLEVAGKNSRRATVNF